MDTKTCSKCGETKALDDFHKQKGCNGGYRPDCKACKQAQQRERRKLHPGQTPATKRWQKENPEKFKASKAKWRASKAAERAAYNAEYVRTHRAQHNAKSSRRRAQEMQATPAWADDFFIEEIYDLAQRRTEATGIQWEVDHIVPLKSPKVCGLHVEFNLQVVPRKTNRQKHNRYWPGMPEQGVRYDRLSSAAN